MDATLWKHGHVFAVLDLVAQVLPAMELPADEPYHVEMSGLGQQTCMEEPESGWVS